MIDQLSLERILSLHHSLSFDAAQARLRNDQRKCSLGNAGSESFFCDQMHRGGKEGSSLG